MTMLTYPNPWERGENFTAFFTLDRYVNNNCIYVGMNVIGDEGIPEPWCDVTVNIGYYRPLEENEAFIDMPNIYDSQFLDWLRDNELIEEFEGEYGFSGFNRYPLVKFNLSELQKHTADSEQLN